MQRGVRIFGLLFGVVIVACGGSPSSTIADNNNGQTPVPADPSTPAKQTPTATSTSSPSSPVATTTTTTPTATPAISAAERRVTCLANHYVGTPVQTATAGAWALTLPDGTQLTWDDGIAKSYDDKLATPDLEDTLSMPYTMGPITPVLAANQDPGRIRDDDLFKATFGATSDAVQAKLVDVTFVGQTVKFHTLGAAALAKVSTHLTQLVAQTASLGTFVTGELGGTFNWRPIADTNRLSAHSYGIAIDIATAKSDYWEWELKPDGSFVWKNSIPQAIVDAFESEGFVWGGRWAHFDTMHFEYRPELFDKMCSP